MVTITIPKKMARRDDLVVISKKELEALIERADEVTEKDIVRWAREARKFGKAGKLPPISFLRKA